MHDPELARCQGGTARPVESQSRFGFTAPQYRRSLYKFVETDVVAMRVVPEIFLPFARLGEIPDPR